LVVTAPTLADFSLAVSPGSRTIVQGASTSYIIGITRSGGLSGAVTLSAGGLPSGATSTFSPNPSSANSSTLTVKTSATSPPGTFALTIAGVSGSLRHTAKATIIVTRSGQCDGQCQ
jgi:serine protease AprX